MQPNTLILRTAGTNCDVETAYAFELAGARAERVHINQVLGNPAKLSEYQLLAIPGGFSYGDDIAAGRIFANQIVHHLRDAIRAFIDAGKPVIGVCNGFQVLVKTDLLPGNVGGRGGQNCTLAHNDCGRFIDRWVSLKSASRKCVWTQGIGEGEGGAGGAGGVLELPIAHGEGKFVPADDAVRKALWANDQVALVYVKPDGSAANGETPHNPNGSVDDIAGVCDASGLVLGLMPHPERYVTSIQHPAWARRAAESQQSAADGAGIMLFRNAVRHVRQAVGAGV
jgi:phosphoribosylformylglycinamidine synthase I